MFKNRVNYVRNITQKRIVNDGRFTISVVDVPMQNTEVKTEEGITDKTIDLQRLSKSRIIVNSVETVQPDPEAVETP